MTALTNKLQEITKRLQRLTVWKPSERDPYFELDRWRTDAHATIEQIFNKKQQQIQQLIQRHEREFMRHLERQRLLLSSVRKRLLPQKENSKLNHTRNDTSIVADLQKVENDINIRLGRAEISIETSPLNIEDSVLVSLKTYFSGSSSISFKEMSTINQTKKPIRRSNDEIVQAFEKWVQVKNRDAAVQREIESTKRRNAEIKERNYHVAGNFAKEQAFYQWLEKKNKETRARKRLNATDSDIKQEANNDI